jgi:hypothetical protein
MTARFTPRLVNGFILAVSQFLVTCCVALVGDCIDAATIQTILRTCITEIGSTLSGTASDK